MYTISNVIKAIECIRTNPNYTILRIAHGKDVSADPPIPGPQVSEMKRTAGNNITTGVNDGFDGDHVGENGLGLTVNMNKDALGINDGGEGALDVNTQTCSQVAFNLQFDENLFIGSDAVSWIPLVLSPFSPMAALVVVVVVVVVAG